MKKKRPIKYDQEMLTREQIVKDFIKELLPDLYGIRAGISLTYGKNARKQMKELINRLEKESEGK